jgi:hypothetical protein
MRVGVLTSLQAEGLDFLWGYHRSSDAHPVLFERELHDASFATPSRANMMQGLIFLVESTKAHILAVTVVVHMMVSPHSFNPVPPF